jgi:HSP20 family protein
MTTCSSSTCAPASDTANVIKPRYTVNTGKDSYEVRVELPGVRKDSVSVNLDQDVLSIRAQRKPAAAEGWKALHRELRDFGYALRLKLNAPVNDAALSAKLEDGVLVLSLPVKEAAKPRTIAVQ